MRNHEMVYFFYEQAPKYNRDKYHKRIAVKNDTINGAVGNITSSVMEEKDIYGETKKERKKRYKKNGTGAMNPPNPASIIEDEPVSNTSN